MIPNIRYRLVEFINGDGDHVWRIQFKRRLWPVWRYLESEHIKYRWKEYAVDKIKSKMSEYSRNNLTMQRYIYGTDDKG